MSNSDLKFVVVFVFGNERITMGTCDPTEIQAIIDLFKDRGIDRNGLHWRNTRRWITMDGLVTIYHLGFVEATYKEVD